MAIYKVQAPTGEILQIEGPDGASAAEVEQFAAENWKPDTSAGGGRGSINPANALDVQGRRAEISQGTGSLAERSGARADFTTAEINRLREINPGASDDSLANMAVMAYNKAIEPKSAPVNRERQYTDQGYSAEDAKANAAFDQRVQDTLNKRANKAAPDERGDRVNIPYNPNTENVLTRLRDQEQKSAAQTVMDRDFLPDATIGSVASDLLADGAKILPTAVKSVTDLASMATGGTVGQDTSKALDEYMKGLDKYVKSDRGNAQQRNFERDLADSNVGILDALTNNKAALSSMLLPTIGSMALPVGLAGAVGSAVTKFSKGMEAAALAAKVGKAEEAAVIGATVLQNASDTFSTVLDKTGSLKDAYLAAGITAPFSAIAGKLTGGGAEMALAKRLFTQANTAGKVAANEAAIFGGALAKAWGKEAGQEMTEQFGQSYGEAVGTGEKMDPTRLGKELAVAGVLGGMMGGGVHGLSSLGAKTQEMSVEDALIRALQTGQTTGAPVAPTVESQPTTPTVPEVITPKGADPTKNLQNILKREGLISDKTDQTPTTVPTVQPPVAQANERPAAVDAAVPGTGVPNLGQPTAPAAQPGTPAAVAPTVTQSQPAAVPTVNDLGTGLTSATASGAYARGATPTVSLGSTIKSQLELRQQKQAAAEQKQQKAEQAKVAKAEAAVASTGSNYQQKTAVGPQPQGTVPTTQIEQSKIDSFVKTVTDERAKHADITNESTYPVHVLQAIADHPDAGPGLKAVVTQEITARQAWADRQEIRRQQNLAGKSAELPESRTGARPLSVARGAQILTGLRNGGANTESNRMYLQSLRSEIGDANYDFLQRSVNQPFLMTTEDRITRLPNLLKENDAAIQAWDNAQPKGATPDAQPLQPGYDLDFGKRDGVTTVTPKSADYRAGQAVDSPAATGAGVTPAGAQGLGNQVPGEVQLGQPVQSGKPAQGSGAGLAASRLNTAPTAIATAVNSARMALYKAKKVTARPSAAPLTNSQSLASTLANMFGRTFTVMERLQGPKNQMPNGFIMPGTNDIYVDKDSEDAPLFVTVHEIWHTLPEHIKAKAGVAIRALFDSNKEGEFGREFGVSKGELGEEIPAYMVQAISKREDFWQELRTKMGNSDFMQFATEVLRQFKRILGMADEATGKAFLDKYVGDEAKILKARDLLIEAYVEAAREQGVQPDAEVTQTIQASNKPVAEEAAAQPEMEDYAASRQDKQEAAEYESRTGFAPYTSAGQIEVPIDEIATPLFSLKTVSKDDSYDPQFNLPLNKNGTVTLYYPTTNEEARRVSQERTLRAEPGKTRVYLTNESSAPKVTANPAGIEQAMDGANVLVQIDPTLLQLDHEHEDGRKDFYIAVQEGEAFRGKMRQVKLFTQNAPRTKALSKDTKLTDIERSFSAAIDEYLGMSAAEQRARRKEAKDNLKRLHNVGTLLGVNGKLEKTNTGGYGLNNYDGRDVMSMGLGLASAQKINEQNLSTCPKSAICESLCLGETSGQNLLYGGDGQFKSGPRLSQYLKTEAMVQSTEDFAVHLYGEIERFAKAAKKDDYQATVRLNVTSDFRPQTFEAIIKAFPDVVFYDYTKLPTKSIAQNHHLTYSSTGASQIVDGKTVVNKESNWNKMIEVLRRGDNVAMAFSDKNDMPSWVVDEKTGEKFQVWNGDNYDARFLDPKPGQPGNELNKGMIIGLTNKDRTGRPEDAAVKNHGFFLDYNKARDGDTLVIKDQEALASGRKVIPIKQAEPEMVFSNKATGQRQIGINVRTDTKAGLSYADLIVDGQKKYETRDTDSLRPYVGRTVGIVRTGEGTAKAIGSVKIGEPLVVGEAQFNRLRSKHLVPAGSEFDIKPGGEKYLYPVTEAKRFDEEYDVEHGIVGRTIKDAPAFSNKAQNLDQDITLDIPLDNGKRAKLTVNAKSYIDSLNAREDALRMVKECLA